MPARWRITVTSKRGIEGTLPRQHRPSSASGFRTQVEERAEYRCEYCRAPQRVCAYRFHLEHIVPTAIGGSDALWNRALACAACNLAKGDLAAATDPQTGQTVPLFNPRTSAWARHFRWQANREAVAGRTKTGRATVAALDMNASFRKEARRLWFETGDTKTLRRFFLGLLAAMTYVKTPVRIAG